MNNIEIIFSKTLTMQSQVSDFIVDLTKDKSLKILIIQGFQDLKDASEFEYPLGEKEPFIVKRIRHGRSLHVELVKRLSTPRIFEMKIDYNRKYHRLIYFPYVYNGERCYIFVYGFTKVKGKPDPTNYYMSKTKMFYDYLRKHGKEEKYFRGE